MFQDVPTTCLKTIEKNSKTTILYYQTEKGKKHKNILKDRYTNDNPMHNPKHRKSFDIAVRNPVRRKAISDFVTEQYRLGNKLPPINFVNHKTIHGYFYSKKNQCKIHFRGGIELKAYLTLEQQENVLKYEDDTAVKIAWSKGETNHTYHPDILVWLKNGKKLLVECKPKYLITAGGFTGDQREDSYFVNKVEAAEEYCKKHGWLFELWSDKCLGL